jgi:hypothetical protein
VTARIAAVAAVLLLCGGHVAWAGPVQAENALPGTAAWNVFANNYSFVYASEIGIAPGDEIDFHVSTAYRYRLEIFRLGWYGGAGGRLVACSPSCGGDEQGAVRGGQDPPSMQPLRANWPVTDVVRSGADWVSGYYLAEAVQTSGSAAGTVATTWFIVRQAAPAAPSQVLVQVPVNTWEAYNDWGGRGLYNFISERAARVSFLRPFAGDAQTPLWNELQLVRFLEREGYDVSYQIDADTDADPAGLSQHRLVLVNGHAEYWTMNERLGFDAAVAAGTNLAFMGANDAFWHVEYEDGRTTIHGEKSLYDPNPDPAMKTAMFREIGRPECLLEGVQHTNFTVYDHPLDYTVTPQGAADPWLAGTGLTAGSTIAGVVGREHDALIPGCAPADTVDLFHYSGVEPVQNADALRYTAPSGARVFASGAYNFTLALDGYRSTDWLGPAFPVGADRSVPVDPRVQQFMRNALADLTSPQPPAAVRVWVDGDRLRVATGWPDDRRIVGRLVYRVREPDGARRLVCSGHTRCYPAPAPRGRYRFDASYVDEWGGISAATPSGP